MLDLQRSTLMINFLPLGAALITGLAGKIIGRRGAHTLTILAMTVSLGLSLFMFYQFYRGVVSSVSFDLYTWAAINNGLHFSVGFLIDELTAIMLATVTFISWVVHLYTMGYMKGDPSYQRFFCYISLFTFGMLMLVSANNFLQLYFGWEMVGLMSYLLIGFWFYKESAVFANLKAFIVNRVGDFGFIIGIAAIFYCFGALDYQTVFKQAAVIEQSRFALGSYFSLSSMSFICLCLFIGAMGKSAQVPLHVWLPDSMEGPTPISALIHAATMVTAGVFMLARLSPLFEQSDAVLNLILVIGTLTVVLMGLVGIVQNDIKRIIAYSTLSQLGYMMAAMGVSAYSIGIFHLVTHAFFKALLFLGAGVVILALEHEQDIWKMGALKKALPVTYCTMLAASLALIGFPFFSGFYSKDLIIEAVKYANLTTAGWAYYGVLGGIFITALYTFRLFFVVFHGSSRLTKAIASTPNIMSFSLLLLVVPAVFSGGFLMEPLMNHYFKDSLVVYPVHASALHLLEQTSSAWKMGIKGFCTEVFFLSVAGVMSSWLCYVKFPKLSGWVQQKLYFLYWLCQNKFGFDAFYLQTLVPLVRGFGLGFWHVGDEKLIDGVGVTGTAFGVRRLAMRLREWQTGYLYHYAFVMVLGLLALIWWTVLSENI
jgi:NADH-quinone oxidoreductase subunit L